MTEDTQRLDWLEHTAAEFKITIRSSVPKYELWIGQICVHAVTLRQAIDEAMEATKARP